MPSITNTGNYTNLSGQLYYRGTQFYPLNYQRNFARLTTQNYSMLKQISRNLKQYSRYSNNKNSNSNKRPNYIFNK